MTTKVRGVILMVWYMACRRHCRCQLQPVPGRDVWDGIRSGQKLVFEALAPSSDMSPLRFSEFSVTAYCVLHAYEDMIIAHGIITGESSSNPAFTIAVASFVLHLQSMEMLCYRRFLFFFSKAQPDVITS